jgi:hypothetical protein
VLLARFSAPTYNGHRIHHDVPYAAGVEGYPDLVIHGPLLALLALELPRRVAPEATVTEFAYRLVQPLSGRRGSSRRGCPTVMRRSRGGRRGRRASLTAVVRFGLAARGDGACAGGLAEDGHPGRVAAERGDPVLP